MNRPRRLTAPTLALSFAVLLAVAALPLAIRVYYSASLLQTLTAVVLVSRMPDADDDALVACGVPAERERGGADANAAFADSADAATATVADALRTQSGWLAVLVAGTLGASLVALVLQLRRPPVPAG